MTRSKTVWLAFAVGLAVGLTPAGRLDAAPPLLLQHPSLSKDKVAFDFAGEIWLVAREGGVARRLVAGQGRNREPIFSPDGRLVAYTGTYDGNADVYVIPAAGGQPTRLTHHPGADQPIGWTPDGRAILFRSERKTYRDLLQLFTVPVAGGFPTELPLPSGDQASYSPDGSHLAYVPYFQWQPAWKKAYVYIPDTFAGGFANFNRYYFSQVGKQAVVLDERFNHGGSIADYIVDYLKRTPQMANTSREGDDVVEPAEAIYGPKVMIANQMSGSGGDALPWLFKKASLGPLVGVRTWGGLVGIGGYPPLLDGGFVTAPRWGLYGTKGEWEVENKGIAPDIEVEQDPALVRKGQDPQLDKAVAVVLDLLEKNPAQAPAPAVPGLQAEAARHGGALSASVG